ncbi:MAG: ComF family protein [Hyphomonadaceae bacterium]|nr:ComF family protein [Hyphomonadaceae bacterium]
MRQSLPDYVATSRAKDKRRQKDKRAKRPGAAGLAGLIWLQRSLVTNRKVAKTGALEPELWAKLQFLSDPVCRSCRAPFEIAVDVMPKCGTCLAHPPVYDRAWAALVYGDVLRDLVLGLKYRGRDDGLSALGGRMASAGAELLNDARLIVPVPLHYCRLVWRRLNQSAWPAAGSRTSGVKPSIDVLKRVKSTPIQGELSADGRRRNVQGAFAVRRPRIGRMNHQKSLLVDDVLTTGATAEAALGRYGVPERHASM